MGNTAPRPRGSTDPSLAGLAATAAPVSLYVLDIRDYNFCWLNTHAIACLGYGPEDVKDTVQNFATGLIHPEDVGAAQQRAQSWAKTYDNRQVDYVQRLRHKSGRWCWFACSEKTFQRDSTGAVTHIVGASLDITARKEVEELDRQKMAELQERVSQALQNYERLADSIPQLVWVVNNAGEPVYFNQPWIDYTGVSMTSSADWNQIVHPNDVEGARRLWIDSMATGTPYNIEYRLKGRDGVYRWHLTRAVPVQLDGSESRWFGTCTDIDDAKRAAEALHRTQQGLHTVLHNAPVMLWGVDLDGVFTMAEGKVLETLELAASDLVGFPIHRLFAGAAEVDDALRAASKGHECCHEIFLRGIWLESYYSPLRDHRGHICGVVVLSADVTARKESVVAKTQRAKLEAVVATQQQIATAALEPHSLMSLVADRALALVGAETAFVSILEDDEFVVQGCAGTTTIKPGFSYPKAPSFAYECMTKNRTLRVNVTQDDSRTVKSLLANHAFGSAMISPLQSTTGPIGVLSVTAAKSNQFDDDQMRVLELLANLLSAALTQAQALQLRDHAIASLRAAEADLKRAKTEAERAADAKADFLASMSHEIRTPLNGVIGMTDMLLETPLSALQANYSRILQSSGNTLLTLVNDILDFSKIEAGKLDLENIPVDVAAVVETQLALISARAREKGLQVRTQIAPELQGRVHGDPTRIGQAVLNFASNAVKFTHAGAVTVRATLEQTHGRAFMRLAVIDTGIGLAPEAQARLFQPFSQASGTTTRQYGGTGLGLVITRRLVELMGGEVGLQSTPGQGSTFWFRLPLHGPAPASKAAEALPLHVPSPAVQAWKLPASVGQQSRILVCDDNAVNQLVATSLLRALGFESDAVSSGADALAALAAKPYAMVLMDCQMPEMDGYETTARIRELEKKTGQHLPIVALTAGALAQDRARCVSAGMDDYLTKPIKKPSLQEAITRWLLPSDV